ncbi:MAG: DUF4296 domain-containing protein [Bacteroidales bacterium]
MKKRKQMQKRLSECGIALCAVALLAACSKVPGGVLPEKKMKDVMLDIRLAENMINGNYQAYPDSTSRTALFASVFRKHRITQALYDSSLVWYGKNMDVLLQVYDLALRDVNERIRELGDTQASAAP